jgi:hypothetical protein
MMSGGQRLLRVGPAYFRGLSINHIVILFFDSNMESEVSTVVQVERFEDCCL